MMNPLQFGRLVERLGCNCIHHSDEHRIVISPTEIAISCIKCERGDDEKLHGMYIK